MANKITAKTDQMNNNTFIVMAVLISLITLIISVAVGRVLFRKMAFNNRVLTKKSAANDQLEKNIANIESLRSNYLLLGGRVKLIEAALPNNQDFPGLSSVLESISSQSGVKLESVSLLSPSGSDATSTTSTSSGPVGYGFTAKLTGSYSSVLNFVKNIELSARPLRVTAIEITGVTADLEIEITMSSYHMQRSELTEKTEVVK